jgi:uncharacterized OB-fold protein
MYPKRAVCPRCKERRFSEFEISGLGTVLTYTKLYAVPEGVDELPLILGISEFGDVMVTGQIVDKNVKVGDKVRLAWGKLRKSQGKEICGFKFEVVR